MIRGYEEQFEGKTVDDIRELIARIESLSFPSGVSRYYAVDLSLCLQGGALLGALQVAASLLEIFVREIVIERASEAYSESEKNVGSLQQQLEQMKNIGFKKLVDELFSSGMWSNSEAELAKQFYDEVRIPIHHGLPARFVKNINNYQSVMGDLLGYTQQINHRDFEKVIEENALVLIDTALGIIERNTW
jgi:hypothetical protein